MALKIYLGVSISMCLVLLALGQHKEYPLVILLNRDEQYDTCSTSLLLLNRQREVELTEISHHNARDMRDLVEMKFSLYEKL